MLLILLIILMVYTLHQSAQARQQRLVTDPRFWILIGCSCWLLWVSMQ